MLSAGIDMNWLCTYTNPHKAWFSKEVARTIKKQTIVYLQLTTVEICLIILSNYVIDLKMIVALIIIYLESFRNNTLYIFIYILYVFQG